ncbi:MAG: cytochrome c [Acidobacteria bacterium]|nr:cytochrome c [Acidobacteriota bacterium]
MNALLLLFFLFAQNPASPPAPAPRGNAENGKALFTKIGCYECHGLAAQGAAATGPRLAPNPVAYARFLSYIRKPTGEMPPYTAKVVTDQQAADIYAFLQSVPRPPAVQDIPLLRQ